jgi:hypothetical protein
MAILCESQQKFPFMAAVSNVPNLARDEITIGSGHGLVRLKASF